MQGMKGNVKDMETSDNMEEAWWSDTSTLNSTWCQAEE